MTAYTQQINLLSSLAGIAQWRERPLFLWEDSGSSPLPGSSFSQEVAYRLISSHMLLLHSMRK